MSSLEPASDSDGRRGTDTTMTSHKSACTRCVRSTRDGCDAPYALQLAVQPDRVNCRVSVALGPRTQPPVPTGEHRVRPRAVIRWRIVPLLCNDRGGCDRSATGLLRAVVSLTAICVFTRCAIKGRRPCGNDAPPPLVRLLISSALEPHGCPSEQWTKCDHLFNADESNAASMDGHRDTSLTEPIYGRAHMKPDTSSQSIHKLAC